MDDKVALVKFIRGSFDQEYSYITDIDDLEEGEVVVVQTNDAYSIAIFQRYSEHKSDIKKATKWIVQVVDTEAFETKLFLGDL